MSYIKELASKSKISASELLDTGSALRDKALLCIADALDEHRGGIKYANKLDLEKAEENNMTSALIDRLTLTDARIDGMRDGVLDIVKMADPAGFVKEGFVRPNGLQIQKVTVPIGVIGIIFESRPNVTVDAAALCLKAGNAVILRGGKEAINSNRELSALMRRAVKKAGLSADVISFVDDTSRETASAMMKLNDYIDLLVPRGGASLINAVVENATVPVIQTGVGNCHIYVHADADIDMAVSITENAKVSRPSVCNAAETVIVDQKISNTFLPILKTRLDKYPVELVGCPRTVEILGSDVKLAGEDDYYTEFLDLKLAVKVSDGYDDALAHIRKYSSGHSEAVITQNYNVATAFTRQVDSSAVYVNASTRFTDGAEFGYGAEIGISTQKLHARGPMGLQDLTSVKYVIMGNGQIRN
ncbi:MAG: glutamate-5-semialdehyde dehydrogenase [Oscillospiraceae bacterium]|nr:glutamate-5-semialdehyde dehydrogenase [Oscillospiraceae bacterium]